MKVYRWISYKLAAALLAMVLASLPLGASTAYGSTFDNLTKWFDKNLIDPEDGMLDASNYLASAHGIFPAPIIITEPAVGFGIGAAVAYFHQGKDLDPDEHQHSGPPSISVGFGAVTDNETHLYGGAHSGVWKDDHIRYLGALAAASVNLKFYPGSRTGGSDDEGIRFNVDGTFLYQQIQFRLRESNWWLGANYLYINAENTFRVEGVDEDNLPDPQFQFNQAGVGTFVEYDGRNTTFTATDGLRMLLEYRNYDQRWGSDFDYNHALGSVYHYTPFGAHSSLGLRLDGETVSGEVPFFAFPYINLRGIPAMRYQGESTITVEAEFLWGFTPRWSLALFGGAGKTSSVDLFGNEEETVVAGGVGIRYRLARELGIQAGVDVARGPEDTAIYLTIGSAW
jgi:hypothetical protein